MYFAYLICYYIQLVIIDIFGHYDINVVEHFNCLVYGETIFYFYIAHTSAS